MPFLVLHLKVHAKSISKKTQSNDKRVDARNLDEDLAATSSTLKLI